MAMAAKVVSPASEISQPQSRVMGWVSGPAGQEHGVEHAQRKHEVIGPQSQGAEQVSADKGPRAAADVEDFRAFGIDELAGRIAWVVAQQRSGQEHGKRKQAEGQQVLFQVTLFEHETRRPRYRGSPGGQSPRDPGRIHAL